MKYFLRILLIILLISACRIVSYAQWVLMEHPYNNYGIVYSLASNSEFIFTLVDGWSGNSILYRSSNDGFSWQKADSLLPTKERIGIVVKDTFLFVGVYRVGIYRSSDNGESWMAINKGITDLQITDVEVHDDTLYAASVGELIRSVNNGDTWEKICNNPSQGIVSQFIINQQVIILGGTNIWISNDNYNSWNSYKVGWSGAGVGRILSFDQNIFASANFPVFPRGPFYEGIFISKNNGLSWTQITQDYGSDFLKLGEYVFIARDDNGIYRTNDIGVSLYPFKQGIQIGSTIRSFCTHNNYLFAGGSIKSDSGITIPAIWRTSISEATSVNESTNIVPFSFALYQNYPNPFNPTTIFSFSLQYRSSITLRVFDIIGREVATIVSEELSAGNYSRKWDASNLPSGIYFYRLQAGSFTETKKLVLLR